MVLKTSPNNSMGHLGVADSLKGLGRYDEAIEAYSKAIKLDPQTKCQGLLKRGLLHIQCKQYEKAIQDFNVLCKMGEEQDIEFGTVSLSKAYFYKAKSLKKLNNMNDSVLYFE